MAAPPPEDPSQMNGFALTSLCTMTYLINHLTNKLNDVCLLNSSFSFSSLGTWAILQKKNVPVKAKKGGRAIP